jgi:undecaprenyl-diphosphatase
MGTGRIERWRGGRLGGWTAPLGLAVVLLPALVLLTAAAYGDGPVRSDPTLARDIQAVDVPGADAFARLMNRVGTAAVMVPVTLALAALLAARRLYAPAFLVLATIPLRGVNVFLKDAFDSPRPVADLVRITEQADGFGFPSGHAMGAIVFYGAVFYLAAQLVRRRGLRLAVQGFAVLMVLATGFGRVYTGAHWPSDVLGGYLWGLLLLLVALAVYRAGRERYSAFRTRT